MSMPVGAEVCVPSPSARSSLVSTFSLLKCLKLGSLLPRGHPTSENKGLGHFIIQHESQFSEINKWVKKALVTCFHSSASFMKKPSETNKSLSGQVESSYHQEFVILKDFIRGQLVSQGCIYFKSAYFPPIRRDPPRSNFSSIFFPL